MKTSTINDLCCDLGKFFNTKSFNRYNLQTLLRTKHRVKFEVVQELHFKYKANNSVSDIYNFPLLKYIFIEKRVSVLKMFEFLSFDEVYNVAVNMIAACREMGGDVKTFISTLDKIDYFVKYPEVVKRIREDYEND